MSCVTNVICTYDICGNERDFDLLDEINKLCDAGRLVHVQNHNLPAGWFCNGKTLEANIAIGAFNHLALNDWIRKIRENIDPRDYQCSYLQFIVKREIDDAFCIFDIWQRDARQDH